MNYFPFDPDPRASAIALDDKRLTRVFHEATMTLSVAQFQQSGRPGPYSPRVPMPKLLMAFVLTDGESWFAHWVKQLLVAMVERVGQQRVNGYACYQAYVRLDDRYTDPSPLVMPKAFPNLARAAIKGLDFTSVTCTHEAYRAYMIAQWFGIDKRPCMWTHHSMPTWADNELEQALKRIGLL